MGGPTIQDRELSKVLKMCGIEHTNKRKMEDRRRMRSQGLQEGTQLIQWHSVQDPVRIERELAGACRQARQASTATSKGKRVIDNSKISQITQAQPRGPSERPDWAKSRQTNKDSTPHRCYAQTG